MQYQTIGLLGKPEHAETQESLIALSHHLIAKGCTVLVEKRLHDEINDTRLNSATLVDIGKVADLAIVVGGDGNMLGAARVLARHDIHVVGVNRGNLGFLTDISPDHLESDLNEILAGNGVVEERFLLEVNVFRHETLKSTNLAVNEVVLHHAKVAHMMDFEVRIDGEWVFSQRADGLIISTPTGSTAYSLSAGGPILMPDMNTLSLVPMFPHTLTARPIAVNADHQICLRPHASDNKSQMQVSCDSHIVMPVMSGDIVRVRKSDHLLKIVHPPSYNYFNVLRSKLNWGTTLF